MNAAVNSNFISVPKAAFSHPERSEGSRTGQILRFAQNDMLKLV